MFEVPCDEVRRAIARGLDAKVDAAERARRLALESHLGICAACRAAFERDGSLRLVLRRAAASIAVPHALRDRIDEVMERTRRAEGAWPSAAVAGAAASMTEPPEGERRQRMRRKPSP